MAFYRLNARLMGHLEKQRGRVYRFDFPEEVAAKLVALGKLQPVAAPPVKAVPEFRPYAEALAELGVTDLLLFAEADKALIRQIAKELKTTQKIVRAMQEKAVSYMNPPENEE